MDNSEFCKRYNEWWGAKPDEYDLYLTILGYEEEYFEDMTFQPDSDCYDVVKIVTDNFDFFSLELDCNYFRYYIENLEEGTSGQFIPLERSITISPQYKTDRSAILHEMIHAYEYLIAETCPTLCELLLIHLYNKLKPSVPNLDELIKNHAELYGQTCVATVGGRHGILFYLKSLDLDIRCGYSLGKVCGYGRDTNEMFYYGL